jgi:hypothetical protein
MNRGCKWRISCWDYAILSMNPNKIQTEGSNNSHYSLLNDFIHHANAAL